MFTQYVFMGVISIRLPEESEGFLKEQGIAPGALAKELMEKEVRRLRIRQARQYLESISRKPTKPSLEILREERDAL